MFADETGTTASLDPLQQTGTYTGGDFTSKTLQNGRNEYFTNVCGYQKPTHPEGSEPSVRSQKRDLYHR